MIKSKLKKILSLSIFSIYTGYKLKKVKKIREREQKSAFKEYLSRKNITKLQIGSGENIIEGWLNTDLNFRANIAYLDAGNDYPFENETFDFIFSEHLFEHLDENQQLIMLSECFRILKKGGVLRIATPSIEFLFEIYKNPEKTENVKYIEWAMKHSPHLREVQKIMPDRRYDHISVINHFFKAWGHKMIHNANSLISYGTQVGFINIEEKDVGKSDFKELQNLERHFKFIPKEMNEKETMILEFHKN
ncbi:class I SAM-dependent methyltransferase [Zunongwangia atlantica]|uniref:Methyltransferase type 11 domain-containing protein n=1 Tax=Zunongwangia atlantica 22II14-10F7 TaxID=1185767 RepID=A0A1Y1TAL1_9FLAO|nr:methyltransferase domain-containing protein [Zunongwangia atlantica]ORL47423.1 hypothetical protein IIF7_01640 [Zunongwangia atlantica 22II14-10F7]